MYRTEKVRKRGGVESWFGMVGLGLGGFSVVLVCCFWVADACTLVLFFVYTPSIYSWVVGFACWFCVRSLMWLLLVLVVCVG